MLANVGNGCGTHTVAKREPKLKLPLAPIPDLTAWFKAKKVRGVIIGGVAVAFLGRPRTTRDVDAVVLLPEERWREFLKAGADYGFVPRFKDTLEFAHRARMLLVRHKSSGIEVDISLGNVPFEEELLARSSTLRVRGLALPLPSAEDLFILKLISDRPVDRMDLEGLLDSNPRMDLSYVRNWVRKLADAMDTPELNTTLEKTLARRKQPKRKSN